MNWFARWSNAAALAALAAVVLVLYSYRNWPAAVAGAAVLLAAAWALSPLRGRGSLPLADLQQLPDAHHVIILWRPGCVYCLRLRASLGATGRKAVWINIWADREAAAFVRKHNDGHETVPTVLIGSTVLTNPQPDLVRRELRTT